MIGNLGKKVLDLLADDAWKNRYEIWSEMGPYGWVGAHIKTGRSPMAQDRFKTPPDPLEGLYKSKNDPKIILEILSVYGTY